MIPEEIETISISMLVVVRMLGIILDNSIEKFFSLEESEIEFLVSKKGNDCYFYFN